MTKNILANIKQPDLFDFDDYREYLNSLITQENTMSAGISMARFAESFNMSRSALSMLLAGKRDLVISSIHRIADVLHLDNVYHEYFEALVLKCQADNDFDRNYYELKLQKKRKERKCLSITSPSKTLVSEWFVPAILIYLIDIDDDPDNLHIIANGLGITKEHLDDVIDSLRKEGYLSYKGKGNVHISFNRVVAQISSREYLKAVVAEAQKRIDKYFSDPHCYFTTHCFSIPEKDIQEFISEYKNLLNKYMSSQNETENCKKRIVQLSTQFFTVLG